MSKSIVGERIRMLRKEMHLTQSQLAELTGFADKSGISRIENGENDLTQSKIILFANVLNTTPSFLMGWVEDPSPKRIPASKGKIATDTKNDIQSAYNEADSKTQRAVRIMLGLEE